MSTEIIHRNFPMAPRDPKLGWIEDLSDRLSLLRAQIVALTGDPKADFKLTTRGEMFDVRLRWVARGHGHPETLTINLRLSAAFARDGSDPEALILAQFERLIADKSSTL